MAVAASTFTLAAWDELPEYVRVADEAQGYQLRSYLSGVLDTLDSSALVIRSGADMGDPALVPAAWLDWLAALAGVSTTGVDDPRAYIADLANRQRGSVASIVAAVARTLTGSKWVAVDANAPDVGSTAWDYETTDLYDDDRRYDGHTGDPYRCIVYCWTSEMPDADATLAAARAEVPAWMTVEVIDLAGLTYAALAAAYATYTLLTGSGLTYAQLSALT